MSHNILQFLTWGCLLCILWSCNDDISYRDLDYVPEGEPALVTVKFEVADMAIKTREVGNAAMDPGDSRANIVNSLWYGIYNKSTGYRITSDTLGKTTLNTLHDPFGRLTIQGIPAYSGECYIVGVANYTNRNGISLSDNNSVQTLLSLLQAADNWEKYKSIVRILDDPTTQRGGNDLLMSGCFQSGDNDIDIESQLEEDGNPPTVLIYPGINTLNGKIHLRRLDSYIRVNLKPGPNINFTPNNWQIVNVPAAAYLHEQNGNAADLYGVASKMPYSYENTSYFNSDIYSQGTFESIFGGAYNQEITGFWFDFYQMENKHSAREDISGYNDREREYKAENGLNTGWYKSLVSEEDVSGEASVKYKDRDGASYNNNASYMIITGEVDYYIDNNNNPIPEPSDKTGFTRRIATVTWTVHLGYCEPKNDEQAKAKDFNCRRNSRYTYNINILGVDNIRVEAIKDGENQPGMEGTVNDVMTQVVSLDSHYGVVNIALTDNERRDFIWRLQSSFGGETIDMMSSPGNPDIVTGDIINIEDSMNSKIKRFLPDNQFYNWIQIRPTKDAASIAPYPGDIRLLGRKIPYVDLNAESGFYPTKDIKTGVDGVWYLEDLRDLDRHPHPYDTDENGNKKKWYTFFIDEYVWEYPLDKNIASFTGRDESETYDDNEDKGIKKEKGIMKPTEWGNYVGEPNRKLWITSNNAYISDDTESVYNSAIYYIDQESIQTFYSEKASSGIGIECTNESFLSDVNKWTFTNYNDSLYDNQDGYLNQYRFAQTYKDSSKETRLKWEDIYSVVGENEKFSIFRQGQTHVGDTYSNMTYYIRDHINEYMAACLSRNRDLNNDGEIGSNEIRWYLPTDQTYTRIILGASALKSPLFELNRFANTSIKAGEGKIYSHYAASNNRMTWAEEFASTGKLNVSGTHAGTLRCVRNIGQPTYWTPDNDDSAYKSVTLAYDHDEKNRTIEMKYFQNTALRNTYYGPWEYIRAHNVGSVDGYAFRKFQYAQYDCKYGENLLDYLIYMYNRGNTRITNQGIIRFYTEYNNGLEVNFDNFLNEDNTKRSVDYWTEMVNNNGICRAYYEKWDRSDLGTWRTPNITELGILKLFNNILDENANYISCSQEYFLRQGIVFNNEVQEDHYRFLTTFGQDLAARYPARGNGMFHIRCVKDVR